MRRTSCTEAPSDTRRTRPLSTSSAARRHRNERERVPGSRAPSTAARHTRTSLDSASTLGFAMWSCKLPSPPPCPLGEGSTLKPAAAAVVSAAAARDAIVRAAAEEEEEGEEGVTAAGERAVEAPAWVSTNRSAVSGQMG